MNLKILIYRHKISHNYKRNPELPDDWWNNDINNMRDEFSLWADEQRLFYAKCQTVANIPGGRYEDTIAPGPFAIKLFVEQRLFHCRIHGIVSTSTISTYDLDGELVDSNSVQAKDKNRWLIHDFQKLKPNPPGQLTRVAWSAGCFILEPKRLEELNTIFESYKLCPGDIVSGELREI